MTIFETSMRYTLWESGCTYSINNYCELYTEYKNLDNGDNIEVNGIRSIIKPKGIGTLNLDLEYDTVKIHNICFKNVYYFPGAHKLLIGPQK